jgi:hypothetical protein
MHASERDHWHSVGGGESTRDHQIFDGRIDGARYHRSIDAELRQCLAQLESVLHLARRDLEADHLATLRQNVPRGVENLPARRRYDALGGLLSLSACAPRLPLCELDARRLNQDRQREHGEHRVRQTDAPRANHAGGVER